MNNKPNERLIEIKLFYSDDLYEEEFSNNKEEVNLVFID